MIIFKKVEIVNFLSSSNNVVEFDTHGLVLIKGTDRFGNSNGTGKSLLLEAIYFGLYGKTLRQVKKLKEVIKKGTTRGYIKLWFSKDKTDYVLKRSFSEDSRDSIRQNLELMDGNENVMSTDKKYIEKYIKKLIPEMYFTSAVVFTRQLPNFVEMTDKEKKQFIVDYLNINALSNFIKIVKEKTREKKKELDNLAKELNVKKTMLMHINETIMMSSKENIKNAFIKLQQIANKIEEIQPKYNSFKKLLKQINDTEEFLNNKIKEQLLLIDKSHKNITLYTEKVKSLKKLRRSKICPTCFRELNINDIDNAKEKLNSIFDLQKEQETLNEAKENHKKYILQLEELKEKKKIVEEEYSKINRILNNYKTEKIAQEELINKYKDMKTSLKEKMQEIKREVNKLEKEYLKKQELFTQYDKFNKAFQNRYLLSYILNYYLKPINEMLEYFTQKVLPTWVIKLKIDNKSKATPIILYIKRNKDVLSFESLSMGEKQRVVLLLLTTLDYIFLSNYEYCNIKFYDEMFDVLDNKGIEMMLMLLKEFSNNAQIFVISHREIAGFFDKLLIAKKLNNVTTYKYIDFI